MLRPILHQFVPHQVKSQTVKEERKVLQLFCVSGEEVVQPRRISLESTDVTLLDFKVAEERYRRKALEKRRKVQVLAGSQSEAPYRRLVVEAGGG